MYVRLYILCTLQEPGVNKGLGSLFPLSGVCFSLFSFPPRYILGKLFLVPQDPIRPSGKLVGVVPLCRISQGAPPFVGPLPPLRLVASCPGSGNLAHLRFFYPGQLRASNIHNKLSP